MKKIFLLLFLAFFSILANAYDAFIDGIYYNLNTGTQVAEICSGDNNYTGDVVIPSWVTYNDNKYQVTIIGEEAFLNSKITSIFIPNSINKIGNNAFQGCENLTSVNISDLAAWCRINFENYRYSSFSSNPLKYAHHLCLNGEEIKDLVIPDSVTSIYQAAFYGCQGLESVTLPNNVYTIGDFVFYGCTNLAFVDISSTVNNIGYQAFEGCKNLSYVNISDLAAWCKIYFRFRYGYDISSTSNPLFYAHRLYLNGEEIKDLVIPDNVTSIREQTFLLCQSIESVTISKNVETIGENAFGGCSSLTSVVMQEGLTFIDENAFSSCNNLTSVFIPSTLKTIKNNAFEGCVNLTSVNISDLAAWCRIYFHNYRADFGGRYSSNPLKYAHHLYLNGNEIKDLVIPDSVESISDLAFFNCQGLESVTISKNVSSIGSYAFYGCNNMASVYISDSVNSIGRHAFEGCENLSSVNIHDLAAWCQIDFQIHDEYFTDYYTCNPLYYAHHLYLNGEEIKDLVIPDSVTSISTAAFYNCTSLTSVEFPKTVSYIAERAFWGCDSLISIYSIIEKVFGINYNTFGNVSYNKATLYVPLGTLELYQQSNGWKNFNNIIVNNCFYVTKTDLRREPQSIHINVEFSYIPNKYTSLEGLVSLSSNREALKLQSFIATEKKYDLYFDLPKKEGSYTLKIANSFMNANGDYMDQNFNAISKEEEDFYLKNYLLRENELYIVAQSPTTGVRDKSGYTDIVLSDIIKNIPTSSISMISPSGQKIKINSVKFLDSLSPVRHRISYSTLDEDGIYEITIAKGLKSENGIEMLYDQLIYIDLPKADLKLISVEPENSFWEMRHKQNINYTVRNIGTDTASGLSVDVLYLSTSKEWNNDAIELFRDTTSIIVEPERNFTRTIEVTVPPCTEGQYYLILKTNVAQSFNELSYDDNSLSSDTISLSVELLNDTNNKFTLGRGESRLFKVFVDTNKNIEITDKNGIVNLYMGYGGYPNIDEDPKNGIIAMLGSPHFPLTYYLLVSNNGKNQTINQQCELNIREFELNITGIKRTEIVKHKKAWIPIEIIGCTAMPVFYLVDNRGTRTECLNVYAKTETSFYAQFDTETLNEGYYSLLAECDGKTGISQNAVIINHEVANPKVEAKLILPETSRAGSTITAYIDYKNIGNVDVPTPLFVITGSEGSEYAVDGYDEFSDECHIYGMNDNSVLSALLPGESNRISLQIKIPNEEMSNAIYKLKTITEGCDGMDEHFYLQWLDVDPDENPGCYTDEEWDAYCTRLRNNVGNNWHTFIQAMATVTDLCFASDFVVHDATYLYDILKGNDLAEILALMAEENKNLKKAPARDVFVMPGTIYLYDDSLFMNSSDPWKRLVDPFASSKWVKSSYLEEHPLNKNADYVFIAHGMNNTHWEPWIKILAHELYKKNNKNIICVDWGEWSYGIDFKTGIMPWHAASYIDTVVVRIKEALKVVFDGDIDLKNFYFIGHSHGAHICGRLSDYYKEPLKRLTCLDESEELDHMPIFSKGGKKYKIGDLSKRYNAQKIDYYKSSIICGTEWLVGDDNFILAMDDNCYVGPFGKNGIIKETIRHGYSYEWFTATVSADWGIGYHWDCDKSENKKIHDIRKPFKLRSSNTGKRWSGVINGKGAKINEHSGEGGLHTRSIIEDYTNFIGKGDWNYPTPWYDSKDEKKASEWKFRKAFASTIDYKTDMIENKGSINAGTKVILKATVLNSADNLAVQLSDRYNETKGNACHVLYISKINEDNPNCTMPQCNKEQAFINTFNAPLYYLAESDNYIRTNIENNNQASEITFTFNISNALWEKLKDNDKTAHCYLWVVPGVDKTNKDYRRAETYFVPMWKGELRPYDNVKCIPIEVKKPDLSCEAGADQTITLQKDQDKIDVNVAGTVVNEGDYELSYAWKEGNSEFSAEMEGTASLGVGTHKLNFEVEAGNAFSAKARYAPSSTIETISDDVIITVKPYTPGDEDDESTEVLYSYDPNEKVGIKGAGGKSCIRQGETMEYTIYFENDAKKAQLAAQTVTVIDTLDTAFDLTTFEFTGAEASNTFINVPLGKSETTILTDMRPDNDLILKTEMKLDIDKRIVKVVYSSLDTLTYEPTLDVFAGFLPPNDSTHVGEGHFSYRIRLKNDVPDGYVVKNQAHIYFDYNDAIATNITRHVVDSTVPVSIVDGLPKETQEDSVMVSWSGYDDGAGVWYYDIYRSKNGGNYELWISHTTENSAIQYGDKDDIYRYFSVATDSLGFVEAMKDAPEATVAFIGNSSDVSLIENDKISIEYRNGAFDITGAEGATCIIYDLAGQLVKRKQHISSNEQMAYTIKGIYLVTLVLKNGETYVQKITIN